MSTSSLGSRLSFVLGAACFIASAGPAHASTGERLALPDLLTRADLVFAGTVVGIESKQSDVVDATDAKLPHTFVTFAIEDVVKGSSTAGKLVTLRFLGGPDDKGRVLEVSGVPQFALGDRDLLFARTDAICPLVGWEGGRLRLVRGAVYDALGNELWLAPDGRFVAGASTLDLTVTGYPARVVAADGEGGGANKAVEPPAGSIQPDVAGIAALLRAQLDLMTLAGHPQPTSEFQSARVSDVLRFPKFRPSKAPLEPRGGAVRNVDPNANPDHEDEDDAR